MLAADSGNAARDDLLIEVRDLRVEFRLTEGLLRAVDGVSFEVRSHQTLGVMGESGCGKSVTARAIMGILPMPPAHVTGTINYYEHGQPIDLVTLDPKGDRYRDIRGNRISMVFQEPMTALSPVHAVGNQIGEVLRVHREMTRTEAREQTIELLDRVGISDPERRIKQYPFELSGGMNQRAMIAMALACRPRLLIADEPTTGLDVTIQAQIMELIQGLQAEFGMAVLFITHDLGLIAEMADTVLTMYMGQIVEAGSADQVFYGHTHPYTEGLLKSIPIVAAQHHRLAPIRGSVPNPYARLSGCRFRYRCHRYIGDICDQDPPHFGPAPGHLTKCWLHEAGGLHETAGAPR